MKVQGAIKTVFTEIEKNPHIINSEADFQALLYRELRKEDEICESCLKHSPIMKTCCVHLEYSYGPKTYLIPNGTKALKRSNKSHRYDIAVFEKRDIAEINRFKPSKLGQVYVIGQNYDGTTHQKTVIDEKTNKKKNIEIKRSIFCSDLIEIKTMGGKKEPLIEFQKDFLVLREGYDHYAFFRKKYNIETKLYHVCYIILETYYQDILEVLETLYKDSTTPSKQRIELFVIIGPKDTWFEKIANSKTLKPFLAKKKIFFFQ